MKILDVGGGETAHEDATHIIDLKDKPKDCKAIYIKHNICEGKWPFEDNEFDFVFCKDTLEDVKDPIRVCKEMIRVGKTGLIVSPSIMTECTLGVDSWPNNKKYAGYCHHKWMMLPKDNTLTFFPKWTIGSAFDWTSHIPDDVKKENKFFHFRWKNDFKIQEVIPLDYVLFYDILSDIFGVDPINIKKVKK